MGDSYVMKFKTVRPTGSYQIELPEATCEQPDPNCSSYWQAGKALLLQLSSYVRIEGVQLGARDRLEERMTQQPETGKVWARKVCPSVPADQATAEFVDSSKNLWIHCYLVFTHLTIYATISGPEAEVRTSDNWAIRALRSLTLTIH